MVLAALEVIGCGFKFFFLPLLLFYYVYHFSMMFLVLYNCYEPPSCV